MRLFVAVDLDESRRLAVSRVTREISKRLETAGLGRAVKWVEPRNLHLTIRFIGEVGEDRAGVLHEALRQPLLTPAFDLVLGGAGVFPPVGAPRVLWLGTVQGASELADLHDEVEGRLQQIDGPPEARPFSAHLTLARFKDLDRRQGDAVRGAIRDVRLDAAPCRVEAITLYESRLATAGRSYAPLVKSPLARTRG